MDLLSQEDVAGHQTSSAHAHDEPGTRNRDALRLLFILVAGSEDVDNPSQKVAKIFRAEKRLMAMDFLVRYPDYLADALLTLHEETGQSDLVDAVAQIFGADEPSVRLVRMVRWHHGAYQNVEEALSTLSYYGLVHPMQLKGEDGKVRRYEYQISLKALTFLDQCVNDYPELSWYRDRLELVMRVAAGKSGSALKEWQYEHPEYSGTIQGDVIPSIRDKVAQRLAATQGLKP